MEAKIFVVELPSMGDVFERLADALLGDIEAPKCEKKHSHCCESEKENKFREEFVPAPEWTVKGKPADENLRFGAEFAVDEPMCQNYDERWMFEDDHRAFDRFVEAGEDCVARGLARPDGVTAKRCNAIRQRVDEKPPMGVDLIGETQWWCDCLEW